ncbi:Hypothetical protein TRIATDRAFT_154409, partial [Trichoderma atroviride IMI 206040]
MAANKPKAEPKVKSRDEYTVGWVCALPKEQTAAIAMLDELHAAVQKPANDPNSYSLGSMGDHNVVIACLPKGQTGNYSAATVATWMVSTFPRIKFGFMVGIGGGIPAKVRLGDVVISAPTGKYPGVVQWDMGKAESGRFQRTGSLNNPPTLLLTALATLESYHEMNEPRMFEYLETLKEKWPRLAPKYLRSESLKDVLFKADYNHVKAKKSDDEEDGEEERENCKNCNQEKVLKRSPRETRVHHGLIASGSLVVKDGISRNSLNKYFDNEVYCIEMEAAGLMNNFPCLVIRGISDYADSHKNDSWQEHAAAMAAACAKELLQHVLPAEVERQPSAKLALDDSYVVVEQLITMVDRSEGEKIFNWLTSSDYSVQQKKYIKMHEKGTGQWLLDSAEFKTWIKTERQILFCPGIPGAGKTIITALVVQNLASRFAHDPKVGIAYTYFNFWQQEEHWIEDLFAALLKQLSEGLFPLPASLKALYYDHQGNGGRPSFEKISKVLQSIIRISYERVFIIVDALDECQESNSCRMRFIEGLFVLQQCGANILATSRPITDITDRFNKSTWLEIRASADDIRTYVNGQISQGRSRILLKMRAEASTGIAKAADGMFLLAKLDLDSLLDAKLPKEVKERLKSLPRGSQAYNYAYQGIMKRVEHQGPKSVKFAKSVLSWVTCVKRPLFISELQHALAIEIGESKFDEEYLPQVHDLITVCAGLITLDENSNTIRLFHYTAQEYFEQTQIEWFPDAENDITQTCITYLSFDVFETGVSSTDTAFEMRMQSNQLYDYAAHHWGHHARKPEVLDPLVLDFLKSETKVEASIQALFVNTSGLHLAAYFGIEKAVAALLNSNHPDLKDSYDRTPLSWAAENGHEAVVQLLLNEGADSKAKDQSSLTPLSWAAMSGHETIIVELLLCGGTDATIVNDGWFPLHTATGKGHVDIIELLIDLGRVEVNSRDYNGLTALQVAVQRRHRDAVRLLL